MPGGAIIESLRTLVRTRHRARALGNRNTDLEFAALKHSREPSMFTPNAKLIELNSLVQTMPPIPTAVGKDRQAKSARQ